MTEVEKDMRLNMVPAPLAVVMAEKLLESDSRADVAVIPLYFPGKQRHWWTVGQETETVLGVVILAVNSTFAQAPGNRDPETGFPTVSWARNAASKIAKDFLGDREGTTGWAYIWRDGTFSVTEDLL